jgi:hypothetical protein
LLEVLVKVQQLVVGESREGLGLGSGGFEISFLGEMRTADKEGEGSLQT